MAEMTPIPIVALDVATAHDALALVRQLGDHCRFYKVGSELFTASGPAVVAAILEQGHEVFLDIKLHDIPNTVRGAARAAASHGVSLLTVHAGGGEAMLRAAVEGAGDGCRVLGVTVLTSFDAAGLADAWGRKDAVEVVEEVVRMAELVAAAGGHGVVCSGREAAAVRDHFGARLSTLVPGIRFREGASHDQSRVATPADAVACGARYVVVGRAVTGAADPVAAMVRLRREMAGVEGT